MFLLLIVLNYLSIKIHPQKFWPTIAPTLLGKGLSVTYTQKMLRHSTSDMTLDV